MARPDGGYPSPVPVQPRRLATATGGALATDRSGRSTVAFRTLDSSGPATAFEASRPVSGWAAAGTARDDHALFEDHYDRLLERLRRDLLIERERSGGLSHHLF